MIDRSQNAARDHDPWNDDPEPKLELIAGKLVCSTLTGSRRVLWQILEAYSPECAIPMAPAKKWFAALAEAFAPQPLPKNTDEWKAWAATSKFKPAIPVAGPRFSWAHYHAYVRLWMGFHAWCRQYGMGDSMGRDFVMRLGENGFEPDVKFLANDRMHQLREYFCEGPATIAIEVLQAGNQEQEREIKRRAYAAGGVPEYWIVDPFAQRVEFLVLSNDGRYTPAMVSEDGVYRSAIVPGLALRVAKLWEEESKFNHLAEIFEAPKEELRGRTDGSWQKHEDYGKLGWDTLPFAPVIDLAPVPIRFEQFIAWAPEAKFEWYEGRPCIGSVEGTRRVLGMLLMTLGLFEAVKLIEPARWIAALEKFERGDRRWAYGWDEIVDDLEREARRKRKLENKTSNP